MSLKAPLAKTLRVALIQLKSGTDKAANLANALRLIAEATASGGVDMVVLPECFNSPYAVDQFRNYAETIPDGETTKLLSKLSKDHSVYIVGGSIPELDQDKVYNTSLTFDPLGSIVAKHRKVHLFDIDIPGGITFKELVTLTGGNKATVFKMGEHGNVGLGICYDMRFPELAHIAARLPHQSFAMVYPGAFNTTTGPLHWHLLARSRAVDNQLYTILCSPARNVGEAGYQAYGHSLVCDPMGNIIAEAGEGQEIIYADLEPEKLSLARTGIPVNFQRRFDVYEDFVGDGKAKVCAL